MERQGGEGVGVAWQAWQEESGTRKIKSTWMEELVSALLEANHHMWIARNGVLHQKDEDGLPICQDTGVTKLL